MNGVDVFWGTMAEIKNPVTDSYQYKTLSKLAKACCILPTSNADTERMFSILKKIQTDQRSELNIATICELITAKQNQDIPCFEYEPSDSLLKSAKKAVLSYQSSLVSE